MKSIPKYIYIIGFLAVFLTIILFIAALYNTVAQKDVTGAAVWAALASVTVAVSLAIIGYIKSQKCSSILIEHKLNDEHFVDRNTEYSILSSLLKSENKSIFYITGKFGMGKTYFMKMMCDRINYLSKRDWKKYVAFYYTYDGQQKIDSAIASKFCGKPEATIADVSRLLNNQRLNKKCVLFIDHIPEVQKNEVTEFAKAFVNCNKKNQTVIAIDGSCSDTNITPSQFYKMEIKMLADSYCIDIPEHVLAEMNDISQGYPIYAHYNVKAYLRGVNITDYEDIVHYLSELLSALNPLEKNAFSLILCLLKISRNPITVDDLVGIDKEITESVINSLEKYTFINRYKKTLFVDELIKDKCYELLPEYHKNSYSKLYHYYMKLSNYEYIALVAALKSDISFDFEFIKSTLKMEYEQSNFYFLISLGELDFKKQINPRIRQNKDCWLYLRYYSFSALLEMGYYHKAEEVVDSYSDYQDMNLSVNNIHNNLDFEYQYLLIDLDHLTNHFEDASTFSFALATKSFTTEQEMRCLYLYAHCIRHIGEDLQSAFDIFQKIATNNDYTNDKIRIRSLYSAASIKIFEHDTTFDYKNVFQKIEDIIISNPSNAIWEPYVNRHKALYEFRINSDYKKAKSILKSSIKTLETTSLRIKYDIYFELGELLRISGVSQKDYEESKKYYQEALRFSKEVGDFNLESNSNMGLLLLNLKFNKPTSFKELDNILEKLRKYKLNINYNNAFFIRILSKKEAVDYNLIKYWERQKYSDLLQVATGNKSEQVCLKLTVM